MHCYEYLFLWDQELYARFNFSLTNGEIAKEIDGHPMLRFLRLINCFETPFVLISRKYITVLFVSLLTSTCQSNFRYGKKRKCTHRNTILYIQFLILNHAICILDLFFSFLDMHYIYVCFILYVCFTQFRVCSMQYLKKRTAFWLSSRKEDWPDRFVHLHTFIFWL